MFVIFHSFFLPFISDCDLVCDDIKEAAVHLADFFPRSGQSTSESKEEQLKIDHDGSYTKYLSFRDLCMKRAKLHSMLLTDKT